MDLENLRRRLDALYARFYAGERAALYPTLVAITTEIPELSVAVEDEPQADELLDRSAQLLALLVRGDAE
jgi:hypothetical protein